MNEVTIDELGRYRAMALARMLQVRRQMILLDRAHLRSMIELVVTHDEALANLPASDVQQSLLGDNKNRIKALQNKLAQLTFSPEEETTLAALLISLGATAPTKAEPPAPSMQEAHSVETDAEISPGPVDPSLRPDVVDDDADTTLPKPQDGPIKDDDDDSLDDAEDTDDFGVRI